MKKLVLYLLIFIVSCIVEIILITLSTSIHLFVTGFTVYGTLILFFFLLLSIIMKKYMRSVTICVLILSSILSIYIAGEISRYGENKTKVSAELVIKALENYKNECNEYPQDLNKLIPKYIKNIPKVETFIVNQGFKYELYENDVYRLGFTSDCITLTEYNNRDKEWYYNK